MSTSTDPISQAKDKVRHLLDTQCEFPIKTTLPIHFYVKSLNNLLEEAEYQYRQHAFEQSFILFSRYSTLFLKGLKAHPHYRNIEPHESERIKNLIATRALPRAEELKAKLTEKYAKEFEMIQKTAEQEENAKLAATVASQPVVKPGINFHDENEAIFEHLRMNFAQFPSAPGANNPLPSAPPAPTVATPTASSNNVGLLPTFDRAQKPIAASSSRTIGTLTRVIIPNDITPKFLRVAEQNTKREIETCGILAGRKKDNQYIISHIVVPKQNGGPNSCDTEKEEEMLEYIAMNDLITLGWIHTHPTQTAFLSSVDLHTHLPYQMLMPEAIAIVVSPKFNETGIFSLTQDFGISAISSCRKTGFHEHPNPTSIYLTAVHTSHDPVLQCQIIDLRN